MRSRVFWSGVLLTLSVCALLLGALPPYVPSETPVGPLMRIFDNLAPVFLGVAVLTGSSAIVLGQRTAGAVCVVAALICGAVLIQTHRAVSLPLTPAASADLRVLFFNAEQKNAVQARAIVDAVIATDPDIAVIAEPQAIYPALSALRARYRFVSPCRFDECELLVATRQPPRRFWRLDLNEAWGGRYAVTELEIGGVPVFVVANHLLKPWFSGLSEPEFRRLAAQYNWLSETVVVVGDFNTVPWSLPMRWLLRETGMRALRWPKGTWPAGAGLFALPIDQVLVHNGARVQAVELFGRDFGSNHLGIVADITLP